jgi:predicted AAA+ superfamily ATPase
VTTSGQVATAPRLERFERRALPLIEAALQRTRCVGLFGARQVGKSTLAHQIAKGRGKGAIELNMRRARDRAALVDDDGFFNEHSDKLVIIDEAHLNPEALDAVHQRIEKELHGRSGRTQFLLLGSSASDLQQIAAERLGARLTPVMIEPIHLLELAPMGQPASSSRTATLGVAAAEEAISRTESAIDLDTLWLRGGYPISLLEGDEASFAWRKTYLSSCYRRTLPGGLEALEQGAVKRTLDRIAADQGGVFPVDNSPREFRACTRYLEGLGLVRVLPPWSTNRNTQLTRRPKLYIRDSGLLHLLRACPTLDALRGTPSLMGGSWEGFCIETLICAVGDEVQAFHYRLNDKDEIDLVLEFSPSRRWAIEIKHGENPTLGAGFYRACEVLQPERRLSVHRGETAVLVGDGVSAFPLRGAVEEVLRA